MIFFFAKRSGVLDTLTRPVQSLVSCTHVLRTALVYLIHCNPFVCDSTYYLIIYFSYLFFHYIISMSSRILFFSHFLAHTKGSCAPASKRLQHAQIHTNTTSLVSTQNKIFAHNCPYAIARAAERNRTCTNSSR